LISAYTGFWEAGQWVPPNENGSLVMETTEKSQRHVIVFKHVASIDAGIVAFDFDNMEQTGRSCSVFNMDACIEEMNLGKWPVVETSFEDHAKVRDCLFDLKGDKEFKYVKALRD
jgi:hypothetical protein